MKPPTPLTGQSQSVFAHMLSATRVLIVLLILYFVIGIVYSVTTPPFEASDEISHYPVVRHIISTGRLPRQDLDIDTRMAQEGSQPPLYYLLAALLSGWIDTSDYEANAILNPFAKIGITLATDNINMVAHPPGQSPWQGGTVFAVSLIRWFSLLLGASTIYLSYKLTRTIYPERPVLALLTASVAAFNAMLLFINASVNNDNLLMLLTTLGLLLLVRDLQSTESGARWRATIVLGIVLGLAIVTKVSGAVLLPVTALVVTLSAWKMGEWRTWLLRGTTLVITTGIIGGWWYLRNLLLYGEILGIQRMADVAGQRPPGFGLIDLVNEWTSFWYSYWGVFGGFNLLAPPWFYVILGALSLLAGLGLLVGFGRRLARRDSQGWQIHLVLVLFLIGTLLGIVRWTLMTPASQGRLMFGGIAPISMYLALGLLVWVPRRLQKHVGLFIAGGLAIISMVIAVGTIAPAYRAPKPILSLPEHAVPLDISFGEKIVLAGYSFSHPVTEVGEPLDVTLYWTTEKNLSMNLNLALNGYGYELENVAKLDTWPGGGLLPTSHWKPNALYADHYLIYTYPQADTPTALKLDVGVWHETLDDYLEIRDKGQPIPTVLLGAGALVHPFSDSALPETPPQSSLQYGIQLLSHTVQKEDLSLNVELVWTTTASIPGDFITFVHLFDAEGNRVAQIDGPPRNGYWPTSLWRPGEQVASTYSVPLPEDLPAGEYTVRIGMYDPETIERLIAYDAEGNQWRDWAIVLSPPVELP